MVRTTRFIIQQLYVMPTQCIYVFCVDLRTNSNYFPIQHLLTGLYNRDGCVYCAVRTEFTCNVYYPSKPNGHYMYHQFNIQQFYILPIQCICVFCVDLRTNSDYSPIQHWLTGFYKQDGEFTARYGLNLRVMYITLQSPVVTICTASLTFNNSTFCPYSVFVCFVWIWEQTAIIPLYSTDWLVFISKMECLLRGTDWIFKHNSGYPYLPTQT